jgi:hypothetical protein
MAMSDRLDGALRALREDETGTHPRSEATLDRVLASRRAAVVSWPKRARLWVPIAAVLVVATTALARSGAVPRIRAFVTGTAGVAERSDRAAAPPPAGATATGPSEPASISEPVAPPLSSPPTPPPAAPDPEPSRAHGASPMIAPMTTAARPAAVVAPAPAPERGPSEGDVYARAHKLHFEGGDPSVALAAWDEYLTLYPAGRFAPDARYNRAIDLLKLKRYAEARAALAPFADGTFGGYHAEDARELLRSLP